MNQHITHISKKTFWQKYWHYFASIASTFISLGFIQDAIIVIQFLSIFDISLISYLIFSEHKRFNIVYIVLISILHESFMDSIYGICMISYLASAYLCFKVKSSNMIRYFRLFNADAKMLYFLSTSIFIIFQEILLLITTPRNLFFIFGQMISCIIFLGIYQSIKDLFSKKKRKFSSSSRV